MQSVLGSLVEPAALLAWALVALAWMARRARQRGLFGAVLAVLVAYLAMATPVAATTWVRAWESRADALPACGKPSEGAVLVVLAGGMKAGVRDATDATALSEASLRRTLAAARLARAQSGTKVIVSGGFGDTVREADLMRALLVETGIDPARVAVERESRNTAENARNTAGLVAGRGWAKAPFALVTSALHMPRALATFRHAGIDACAIVVDSRAEPGSLWKAWIPGAGAVADSEAVAHEIIGMVAYRVLGHI